MKKAANQMKKIKTTKKVTPKKIVSRPAAEKVPVVMTGADLVADIAKPLPPKFVPALGISVQINFLSWPAMVELQKKQSNDCDVDCFLLAHALGITEQEATMIKNTNGVKYAALLNAVNETYGATNDDVKKN